MAKNTIVIMKLIQNYLEEVQKRYSLDAAFLFGSQVNNRAHEWSDIDLALVSPEFSRNSTKALMVLTHLAAQIDWRIEPHVFGPNEFNANHPLVAEIQRNSLQIFPPARKQASPHIASA